MHASSYDNMRRCYDDYIAPQFLGNAQEVKVLDLGAADINGSFRPIFDDPTFVYTGADIAQGDGVDLLLLDPYKLPFADRSVDVVVSGQMLEHCEFFWKSFEEMARVVKGDGLLIVIAPSGGPIHRYPVDCYRFNPDGLWALAKHANCYVEEIWRDERPPWHDVVGVFRPIAPIAKVPSSSDRVSTHPFYISAVPPADALDTVSHATGANAKRGVVHYLDALRIIHDRLQPRGYFEIGVRSGDSLALARCPAIGVDPNPREDLRLEGSSSVVQQTSDQFFRTHAALPFPLDLGFVDGLHAFEFALRDFMNIESRSSPASVIVLDDIFPNHPLQGRRVRQTAAWMGDVWKVLRCLKRHRSDLELLPLDTAPGGSLVVCGLDPKSRVLSEKYNQIVHEFVVKELAEPPEEILLREGAIDPGSPDFGNLLGELRDARAGSESVAQVRERIARWRNSSMTIQHDRATLPAAESAFNLDVGPGAWSYSEPVLLPAFDDELCIEIRARGPASLSPDIQLIRMPADTSSVKPSSRLAWLRLHDGALKEDTWRVKVSWLSPVDGFEPSDGDLLYLRATCPTNGTIGVDRFRLFRLHSSDGAASAG